jgi:hypothetical protein
MGWSNTRLIGKVIYTDYIFAFEVAGLVLLVAIIAAIALTTRHAKDSKRQNVSDQVKVRAQGSRAYREDAFGKDRGDYRGRRCGSRGCCNGNGCGRAQE